MLLAIPSSFALTQITPDFDSRLQAPGASLGTRGCSQTFLTTLWWSGSGQVVSHSAPLLVVNSLGETGGVWGPEGGELGLLDAIHCCCSLQSLHCTSGWSAVCQVVAQTLSQAVIAAGSLCSLRARLVPRGCCSQHQEVRLRQGGSWWISSSPFNPQLKLKYKARAFSTLTLNRAAHLLAIFTPSGPSKKPQ